MVKEPFVLVSPDEVRLVRLDEKGREIPQPGGPVIPVGFRRPETLQEQIQRLIRFSMSRQAVEAGMESFEDADDFDVDDGDSMPDTPYEVDFDPILGRDVSKRELERHNKEVSRVGRARAAEALRKSRRGRRKKEDVGVDKPSSDGESGGDGEVSVVAEAKGSKKGPVGD